MHDLLLTFTSNNNARSIILKMNERRLLILIKTCSICSILLCRLMVITSTEINCYFVTQI